MPKKATKSVLPDIYEEPTTVLPPDPNKTPLSFRVLIAGVVFGLIALFAAIINFLSLRQAPPSPPLIDTPSAIQSPR